MDDFTPYGNEFDEALSNLEKVLKHCIQTNISLSTKKFHMMMQEGVVLGHYISSVGVKVDPSKIEVILNIPIPKMQTTVHIFLGHAGYYQHFIANFSNYHLLCFCYFLRMLNFYGVMIVKMLLQD